MSDNCCLPFDGTLYIFKVSVLTVFIKLIIKCGEIENKAKRLPCRFKVNSVILNQTAFSFLEECTADIDQQRVCAWAISHHVTQILDLPSYIKYVFLEGFANSLQKTTSWITVRQHIFGVSQLLFLVYTYSLVKFIFCDRTPSNPQLMSEFMKDCPLFFASVQVSFSQFVLNLQL